MSTIEDLWNAIKDHSMVFQKVTSYFNTSTNFTKAIIPLDSIRSDDAERSVLYMSFGKLFEFDFTTEAVPDNLANNTTLWPKLPKKELEEGVFLRVAQKLLMPLFGQVVLKPHYRDLVRDIDGLTTDIIGIGSKKTFHGTPDGRVNGLPLLFLSPDEEEEEEEVEEVEEVGETSSGFGSNSKDQQS